MGIKNGYEYYEAENGNIHKIKVRASERSPEFQDFPTGIAFNRLKYDFNDNLKKQADYGNDKLLNGLKSKKTIKTNKKVIRRSKYNINQKELNKYF